MITKYQISNIKVKATKIRFLYNIIIKDKSQ